MSTPRSDDGVTAVLFVCLGNICRSPLAEGAFLRLLTERGLDAAYRVESAGTGAWHVGEPADPRSVDVASRNGIRLNGVARQVTPEDFHEFDFVVAMDSDNLRVLKARKRQARGKAEVTLLRSFDPEADDDPDVPDPYYGGPSGFDDVFAMVERSCRFLLTSLEGV